MTLALPHPRRTGPELVDRSRRARAAAELTARADWLEAQLRALPAIDPDRPASGLTRADAVHALGFELLARWPEGTTARWRLSAYELRMLGLKGRGRDLPGAIAAWVEAAREEAARCRA